MNIMCVQRGFTSVTSAQMMDECGFDTKMSLCVSACRMSQGCRANMQICAIVSAKRPQCQRPSTGHMTLSRSPVPGP